MCSVLIRRLQHCKTICLSLDAWNSKNQKSILGVLGHWIDDDWVPHEEILDFKAIQGEHTGENLAVVSEYSLSRH
jgi:hypothetical protein